MRSLLAVGPLVLVAGCAEPPPEVETDSASGDVTSAGTSTTMGRESSGGTSTTMGRESFGGGSGCEVGVCVPLAPGGWAGPVVMQLAGPEEVLADCPDAHPPLIDDVLVGLSVDDTVCGCSCGPVTGVTCPPQATLIEHAVGTGCGAATGDTEVISSMCTSGGVPFTWGSFLVTAEPNLGGASCDPTPVEAFPMPSWANQARTCSGGNGAACNDGGQCIDPTGEFAEICIYQDGDFECPAGYEDKILGYDGFDDTRDCEACECLNPQASCLGEVRLDGQTDDIVPVCDASPQAVLPVGACLDPKPNIGGNVKVDVYVPGGFSSDGCDATNPAPLGSVTPTGATTICCVPG